MGLFCLVWFLKEGYAPKWMYEWISCSFCQVHRWQEIWKVLLAPNAWWFLWSIGSVVGSNASVFIENPLCSIIFSCFLFTLLFLPCKTMIIELAAVVLERKMGHYIPQGVQVNFSVWSMSDYRNHNSHVHHWEQDIEVGLTWRVTPQRHDKVT